MQYIAFAIYRDKKRSSLIMVPFDSSPQCCRVQSRQSCRTQCGGVKFWPEEMPRVRFSKAEHGCEGKFHYMYQVSQTDHLRKNQVKKLPGDYYVNLLYGIGDPVQPIKRTRYFNVFRCSTLEEDQNYTNLLVAI